MSANLTIAKFKIIKGGIILIPVSREDYEKLGEANLLKYDKMNKNFRVVNQKKKSNRHKYYVVEEYKILKFLAEKNKI